MNITMKKHLITAFAITVFTTSSLGGIFTTIPLTTTVSAKSKSLQLNEKDAIKKFQKEFKNSKVVELQLEKQAGTYHYEISGRNDTQDHELTLNAKTGKVISKHSEHLDDDDQDTALDLTKLISRKQATKVAERTAKSGKATSWALSYANGTPIWKIEVGPGHQQHDVKVNANNKQVVSNELDN